GDPGLDPDGVRHGHSLLGDQGRSRRAPRGSSDRRGLGMAGFSQDHRSHHRLHDRRGVDHDPHHHLEGVRHRGGHDRWPGRHVRGGGADGHRVLHVPQRGNRRRPGCGAARGRAADPHHQHPPVPGAGGDPMTAVTEAPEVLVEPKRARRAKDPHNSFQASRTPAYLAVGLIALIWVIPALGILISSFRDPQAIRTSGWWTVIDDLFDAGTWTLQNYETVLRGEGFANAVVNSLAVTIPAVVIPITVAAFAAYAFAWMDFPGRTVLFAVVVGLIVVPLQM